MDYLREAELKHGRIAMLATVGYIAVDVGIIFHPYGAGLSSAEAHDVMCANGVMGNALLWIGFLEMTSYIGVAEMLQGSGREPGNLGLGTQYLPEDAEKARKLRYQEIMNGRLAMLAFGGIQTQSILLAKSFPYF